MRESKALEIILRELDDGEKTWSELVTACKNEDISKSAFYYQYKKLLESKKIEKTEKKNGSEVYILSKTSAHVQEEVADPLEIDFLLDIFEQHPSDEAVEAALKDFKDLCANKLVTNNERMWSFFKEKLNDVSYAKYWSELVRFLCLIITYAEKIGDVDGLDRLKKEFLPRIVELTKMADSSIPSANELCTYNIIFIDHFLNDTEQLETFKAIIEETTLNELDQKIWERRINPFTNTLKTIFQKRKMDVWKWLYDLMGNEDAKIRQRASRIHTKITT